LSQLLLPMNHRDTETQREELNRLTQRVIGLCIEVHRELGPGLLESAYEEALAFELTQAGLAFQRQLETPVRYKGVSLNCGYRIDLLIEGKLILELKAVTELSALHHAQLLTYLKLAQCPLGLLVNFNVPVLKDGLRRVALGELFKSDRSLAKNLGALALLLCASVSLWFTAGNT
jgi:GxxExxY protein